MLIKDKIYGDQIIENQLILDIVNTPEMQRLKGINQYGTYAFVSEMFNTTRFEHCLGVYFLLKKFNASFEEQIAGLIHDIPHTVFSHVVDYVYGDAEKQEYHENHHSRIIKNSKISYLLKKNNIDAEPILNENNFPLLEKEIPDLCADRLDYFMRDTFTLKKSTAKDIANKFMDTNLSFWGIGFQAGSFQLLADIFKIGLKNDIITEDDFFTTDNEIIEKLKQSGNKQRLKDFKKKIEQGYYIKILRN